MNAQHESRAQHRNSAPKIGLAGQAAEEEEDEDEEWVQVSNNAFGAFIHVGLQADVSAAFITCGPMLIISLLIQVIFAEELITGHLPVLTQQVGYAHLSYQDLSTQICNVPLKLQVSFVLRALSSRHFMEAHLHLDPTLECYPVSGHDLSNNTPKSAGLLACCADIGRHDFRHAHVLQHTAHVSRLQVFNQSRSSASFIVNHSYKMGFSAS